METFEDRIAEYKESEVTASPVWIWFTKVDNQKNEARCDICKKTIQIKYGSTSSLITHIKKCHGPLTKYNAGKILDELCSLKDERQKSNKRKLPSMEQQPQKKQRTISDCVKESTPYSSTDPRQTRFNNALTLYLCSDNQPTNTLLRPGFQNLVKTIDPRVTIPHPSTMTRSMMPKMKNTVDKTLKTELDESANEEKSVAFSSDGLDCHDAARSSLYDFSVYFLRNFKLSCETMFVKQIEAPVTGRVLRDFYYDCFKSCGFLNEDGSPKLAIWGVTDGGSNIQAAMKQLKNEGIIAGWHNCFNHKLQLVIKDAMKVTPGMEDSIGKFTKNTALYSRSKTERKALRDECKKSGVTCTFPTSPGGTRWFHEKFMVDAYLKNPREFKLHNVESNKMIPLETRDWQNAQGYSEVLDPLHTATKLESGENYLTLPTVIPVLHITRQKIMQYMKISFNSD